MRIFSEPDIVRTDLGQKRVLTSGWIEKAAAQFVEAVRTVDKLVTIDLSNIDFITLYEWSTVVAMMEPILANHLVDSIAIDLVGETSSRLIPEDDYLDLVESKKLTSDYTRAEMALATRVYPLVKFLELLGTRNVLNNRAGRVSNVFYPFVEAATLTPSKKSSNYTVLMGLTRIDSKEDCRQFLDDHSILNWRTAMGRRFDDSPLFESEEIWRVICHELAINIWEHSHRAGFICARVVEFPYLHRKLRPWCAYAYSNITEALERWSSKGFLELSVVDCGEGFVNTLKTAYMERSGLPEEQVTPENILCFAFDEFGTSKSQNESWATERHALGRILQIVAKYGGLISLRSAGAEVLFKSSGREFERIPNHLGYKPQRTRTVPFELMGSQLQIILPLYPLIDLKKRRYFRPLLSVTLPESFNTEADQVRGHLIPLREKLEITDSGVGREDQKSFRIACEKLSRSMMKRPRNEPFVLDFSDLKWGTGQFETLLHLLQNVLQNRPSLLVEIEPQLAEAADELEKQSAPTQLDTDEFDVSEKLFLETFSRVYSPILGLDQNGRRYLFGLADSSYKEALLRIVETESSIDELCHEIANGERLKRSRLQIILNQTSSVFEVIESSNGKPLWRTVWDARSLANEASRAISRHFDQVAYRSQAWRGRTTNRIGAKQSPARFHLPWLAEWRADFLEASRILSRGRHADEIAQRLIFRLGLFLESQGYQFKDITAIACVTTPAMLLASALHRWWPSEPRPALADLGHYLMLNESKQLPIIGGGKLLVLQDVLDTHQISGDLVDILTANRMEVVAVCGFVQMISELNKTRSTLPNEWWKPHLLAPAHHAMIQVRRPENTAPPANPKEDSESFWVEPRTLRPFRYKTLRRDFAPGRDLFLDRRDRYLRLFDQLEGGSLLKAGHYVYGDRHYIVTLDIRRALTGNLGRKIAHWLADVCEGSPNREKSEWESDRGYKLQRDVTAVLMPLHSQIHYVWPEVENLLAQRGRRQPSWWLESTLFTGAGSHHLLPHQFVNQLQRAVRNAIESPKDPSDVIDRPLRILILDDAIATARTAENILAAILRETRKAFIQLADELNRHDKQPENCPRPIEWIRYFAFLNQMNNSSHAIWHNIPVIGSKSIPIVFDEFAPFMGVPIYDQKNCPACGDLIRLRALENKCTRLSAKRAEEWTTRRIIELSPIAIDSPNFRISRQVTIKRPIEVLTTQSRPSLSSDKFRFQHADTAIWRFYDLMFLSYPPNDVLKSLDSARASPHSRFADEYARYRWAVLDWCLQNWPRIKANASEKIFVNYASQEVKEGSDLIPSILEKSSLQPNDRHLIKFVKDLIKDLASLERRARLSERKLTSRSDRIGLLATSLTLFFFNCPLDSQKEEIGIGETTGWKDLISYLDRASKQLDNDNLGPSFLRNIYRAVTRPERHAEPSWTLETLAEALFRGRDPNDPIVSKHELLPKLIREVRGARHIDNETKRELLSSSLALFMAALEDIRPYLGWPLVEESSRIHRLCRKVVDWLNLPRGHDRYRDLPAEYVRLEDAIAVDGKFCKDFNNLFHKDISDINKILDSAARNEKRRLRFAFLVDEDVRRCRVLTNVQSLLICLANRTIDPVKDKGKNAKHSSCIKVSLRRGNAETDRIVFRLLTNFASLDHARDLIDRGPSGHAELAMLKIFGTQYVFVGAPSAEETAEGFTTAVEISTLAGFVPRRLR